MIVIAIAVSKIVGISAGVLTGASMLPQLIKMMKEKKVSQVSSSMLMILIGGIGLWIWYGILKEDYPIIATNSFSLLVNCVTVFLRFKYRKHTSSS